MTALFPTEPSMTPYDGDSSKGLGQLQEELSDAQLMMWVQKAWEIADDKTKRAFAISVLRAVLRRIEDHPRDGHIQELLQGMRIKFTGDELKEIRAVLIEKVLEALRKDTYHTDQTLWSVLHAASREILENGDVAKAAAEVVLTQDER